MQSLTLVFMSITIEEMAAFCKRKGFVYSGAEIYGGIAGFFDYGHLGVELKNNIKAAWWKVHVHSREDIVGIDGSIITNPKVWEASGHVAHFEDLILVCRNCKHKVRADQFVETALHQPTDGLTADAIQDLIEKHHLHCPMCTKGTFETIGHFNLMFKTHVGPTNDYVTYLRPETAQLIFTNFKLVADNARLKLPFGIAQIGKAFRNEISPRDFLFRCREFEQMEIEYFIHPNQLQTCPFLKNYEDYSLLIYAADLQQQGKDAITMTIKEAIAQGILKTPWHGYWLAHEHAWFVCFGVRPEHLRIRQHLPKEVSHYALDTWDLEYQFPFGWKELLGIANRTDFDLQQHMKHSKVDLSLFDDTTKQKVVPHVVAEPSLGVDRAFLVFLFEAYENDQKRGNIVLHLNPRLAPIKVGVFPLVAKLEEDARKLYALLKDEFVCFYDRSGSIGRRYARADEIGIPYCLTVDFQSQEDHCVTIRDRETTEQKRVPVAKLAEELHQLLSIR